MYYAHSPRNGFPAQSYTEHVLGVRKKALEYAREMGRYSACGADLLPLLDKSAEFHDLGKLTPENQEVLSGRKKAKKLAHMHADAGCALCLRDKGASGLAGMLVFAHHAGLPDHIAEGRRGNQALRDSDLMEETDRRLPDLERIHRSLIPATGPDAVPLPLADGAVLLRLLLSCLVDADHTDTAGHYGRHPAEEATPSLRPRERLARLDRHVQSLDREGERNALRGQMYLGCRDAPIEHSISACDSPVGSGKTFAVMAHLLAQAEKRSLRRIFVVLPYTNIITQSVRAYRAALALPGENSAEVVAELHHLADFESEDARHLTALWRAPIIVTTAVAFFETMASKSPSTLRRLHELPGSAVFVDEAHAALPAHLLPLAWKWMRIFGREWGCYWVLASGSLNRFWQIPEIAQDEGKAATPEIAVPEIVGENLRRRLAGYEDNRIAYRSDLTPKTIPQMAAWLSAHPGPRLVILNTVQSAAVLADALRKRFGRKRVEHLSTALTAEDREKTLNRVLARLADTADADWTLVATSCVEAGVDVSFRTGFRELGSLVSLLQAAGRVNREGLYSDAEIWSFCLASDSMLKENLGLRAAAAVLRGYCTRGEAISPALSTQSIQDEIRLGGLKGKYATLLKEEKLLNFRKVEEGFKVIASEKHIAIIDTEMAAAVRQGKVNWRDLQKKSVQVADYKLRELRMPEILPDLYAWNLPYDDFIGYMAGIIQMGEFDARVLIL